MTPNPKYGPYNPSELVAVVWLQQSGPDVLAGIRTWGDVTCGSWAIARDKADRVKIVLGVYEDVIRYAARISSTSNVSEVPGGKVREINRATFGPATPADPRLNYLIGQPMWIPARRNPQATFEIRDLPGAHDLIDDSGPPTHGIVRLGAYVLSVTEHGAELHVPPRATVILRTTA